MDYNHFTIKAQESIQKAQEIATSNQQQGIDSSCLLKGLLLVDEGVITHLLKRFAVDIYDLQLKLDETIQKKPKVTGGDQY
ncbi:MAG: hypothetical protein ISR55_03450, partial [Bacteroidetes bacterium]|nr:hypothetical protein [Bacteroidota bacterium]